MESKLSFAEIICNGQVQLGRCDDALAEYDAAASNADAAKHDKALREGIAEARDCAGVLRAATEAYAAGRWREAAADFSRVLAYTDDTPDLLYMKVRPDLS